jgi:hypothetical protein
VGAKRGVKGVLRRPRKGTEREKEGYSLQDIEVSNSTGT